MKMKDRAWLDSSWAPIRSQVQVDKVYLETYRSRVLADDQLMAEVKEFLSPSKASKSLGPSAFPTMTTASSSRLPTPSRQIETT